MHSDLLIQYDDSCPCTALFLEMSSSLEEQFEDMAFHEKFCNG